MSTHQRQTIVCLTSPHPHTPFPQPSFSPAYAIGGITTLMVVPSFHHTLPISLWVCTFPNYTDEHKCNSFPGTEHMITIREREGDREGWMDGNWPHQVYVSNYKHTRNLTAGPNGLRLAISQYLGSWMQPLHWLQGHQLKGKAFNRASLTPKEEPFNQMGQPNESATSSRVLTSPRYCK